MIQKSNLECDAVLFDLDGVLIDSTECIVRHWKNWADKHNIDIAEIMQVAHGIRTIETIQKVAPQLDAEKETREFTACEVADTNGVFPIEGARELVKGLPSDAWAIVTSGSLELATARLKHVKLPIPRTFITADTVSRGKPDPEPYLVGAEHLGIPIDKCVVIEDAPAGVVAGIRAGMSVIGIQKTYDREELLKNGADVVVEKLSDIAIQAISNTNRLRIQIRLNSLDVI